MIEREKELSTEKRKSGQWRFVFLTFLFVFYQPKRN